MDGNKKITGIVFAGIVALAITACKVQPPGYVSLYADNLTSAYDTIDPGVTLGDAGMVHLIDISAANELELPVFLSPAEEIIKISPEQVHQYELKELLKAITDSIKLLRHQMIELQKQIMVMPDTCLMREKSQETEPLDSLQAEGDIKQLIQAKNDTILELRKQLYELKNSGIIKADTVYVNRETAKSPVSESRQTDHLTLQLLRAKDEQIQMLQNHLNTMQNEAARTPQPTYITREPSQLQPLGNQQTDQLTLQLLQSKNDTIQFLRSALQSLQLQIPIKDTVTIEKKNKEMQPSKEHITEQKSSDLFHSLQDTIWLLKTRVLSLEEQILPHKDTPAFNRQDQKDVPYKAITDTTLLLVAFYELGEIKPLEEESTLQQIKELCRNKNVTRITLSGYTDSSGSVIINKEITNRRLNYLSEMIIPWITKEKVFFQNFGDTYASDMVVSDERRIEIRIHTK